MAFLIDDALDAALEYVRDAADLLVICSAEPDTFEEATDTLLLGSKASPTLGAPGDRTGGGRKTTVAGFSDGTVTATGTATHWALVDAVNEVLLASKNLSSSQVVTSGNPFSLPSFDIGIPDAV